MTLSIIVVSYNTATLTVQTLNSIIKSSSDAFQKNIEIIVIDNNSSDDSVSKIKAWKQTQSGKVSVSIITNSSNSGFGTANNLGSKKAKGKYLLFLNSDTLVQKGALEKLVTYFEAHPPQESTAFTFHSTDTDNIGIIAPKLLNTNGSEQPQGGSLPSLKTLTNHLLFFDDIPFIGKLFPSTQHTGLRSVFSEEEFESKGWVGGTALCISKELFDNLGKFDENIFMYGEDMELCLRAHHHGYDVGILHTAAITHIQNASSSSESALTGELKGYLYIWSKHMPIWQLSYVRFLITFGTHLRVLLFATIGKPDKAKIYKSVIANLKSSL